VPPEVVDRIAAARIADVIIVEADGSRRLPFKAPAPHEPVVPACTTILVPLVGLDILGQPLDAGHAHRPEVIASLSGAEMGAPITAQTVARVVAHPQGGAKGLAPGVRLVPFLNKADLPGAEASGRELARQLLEFPAVDEVIIAAAETGEPVRGAWGRVGAVVLAAGQGRRFGGLKQVMPWGGKPLVAHVAEQALACEDVATVVVTEGAHSGQVAAAVESLARTGRLTVAPVPDWAAGQGRSAAAGLRAALTVCASLSAAIFLLADQPGISPELLSALIERHRETGALAVAPRFQGARGNPVLFDRRAFAQLQSLTGDSGGRSILRGREDEIAWVDWQSDEILRDIDTREDYAAATGDA
jgi:molybdenum cofactor cytidylyltransferase